jgi:hypothetical protein
MPIKGMKLPVTVTLLTKQPPKIDTELGTVTVTTLPITKTDDYKCDPRNLISLEQAKRLSRELELN